jgi:hypothetical protein
MLDGLPFRGRPSTGVVSSPQKETKPMNVRVRSASLQDGVAVLSLLEEVGYLPEPISFAQTYRKTLGNPHFLVRVAEVEGKIVGMASLSLRYHLGLGGLLASLDEMVVGPGPRKEVERALMQATVGKARSLGARKVLSSGGPSVRPAPKPQPAPTGAAA